LTLKWILAFGVALYNFCGEKACAESTVVFSRQTLATQKQNDSFGGANRAFSKFVAFYVKADDLHDK
jgi:hypothetical protein